MMSANESLREMSAAPSSVEQSAPEHIVNDVVGNFFSDELYANYTSGSMSLGDFARQMLDESIVFPSYQRNLVWTAQLKQSYLVTLSKRGPIFGFVLNQISATGVFECIDGQNRGKTINEFMTDSITYNRSLDEGGGIRYSGITGPDRRIFDRMEIHFIKTLDWDEDDCQTYFRSIQGGMSLSMGEEIHSAQNNHFQKEIVRTADRYNEILTKTKKEGGLNYTKNRYKSYEVIGGLLVMFLRGTYMDRCGQIALKELKSWDTFPQPGAFRTAEEDDRATALDVAAQQFEHHMDYLITLHENCQNLKDMAYSRDSTFIRNMWFLHLYVDEMDAPGSNYEYSKFNEMMKVVLTKKTDLHKQITEWGTSGQPDEIMIAYKGVYDGLIY
jgi:hypothetical protein